MIVLVVTLTDPAGQGGQPKWYIILMGSYLNDYSITPLRVQYETWK